MSIVTDPDSELLVKFWSLPRRWQDEVLLCIAKRRPGLLDEALGDVELCRVATAALLQAAP